MIQEFIELQEMQKRIKELAASGKITTQDEEAEDMDERLCDIADDLDWLINYCYISERN